MISNRKQFDATHPDADFVRVGIAGRYEFI